MRSGMTNAIQIEAFTIVSIDGMLGNAAGTMPDALKFPADQRFFEAGLARLSRVPRGAKPRQGPQ
jgi:hypothetical protein